MAKSSRHQKEKIGLIDDAPIRLDYSKSSEERVADYIRQVNEPFEKAQTEFEKGQSNK
jgi:hypothetical protein